MTKTEALKQRITTDLQTAAYDMQVVREFLKIIHSKERCEFIEGISRSVLRRTRYMRNMLINKKEKIYVKKHSNRYDINCDQLNSTLTIDRGFGYFESLADAKFSLAKYLTSQLKQEGDIAKIHEYANLLEWLVSVTPVDLEEVSTVPF